MPGIFTGAAQVLAARDEANRYNEERARQRALEDKRLRDDEEERKIRQAALIASLGQGHVVANDQREVEQPGNVEQPTGTVGPNGPAMALPSTPDLTHVAGVDQSRYRKLGDTGYSLDEKPGLSFAERRALQIKEQGIQRRMAALRARSPEYKAMPDDALRGIAEDNTTYSDAFKPKPVTPRDPVADHAANRKYDVEHPVPPTPRAPTPEQSSVVDARKHAQIIADIRVRQTAIGQLDDAIRMADVGGKDSVVNQRALEALKTQRATYVKEIETLMRPPVVAPSAVVDPVSQRAAWGAAHPPLPGESKEAYKARAAAAMAGH